MSVVDSKSLEIWVQSGIPEEGELVFNVHIRNLATHEWEVSYRLSQFGLLDIEINKLTDALRDVSFPTIGKESLQNLVSSKKYPNKLKELEQCRMSLEQWVYYVISRIDLLPIEIKIIVENFFILPNGPAGDSYDNNNNYNNNKHSPTNSVVTPSIGDYRSPTLNDFHSETHTETHTEIWDDEVSETKSVWTVGSLDEAGIPKKKKKRIIKGIKKRVSNILGTNKQKENFGVDFTGVEDTANLGPPTANTKSVVSGVSSGGSDNGGRPSITSSITSTVHHVQPGKLLKVRVIRGGEKTRGQHEYEIQLIYNSDKKPFVSNHIFPDFVTLNNGIIEAKGVGIASHFPPIHSKTAIGLGLSEDQQAERTRLLDAWIKDAICTYQYMNDKERSLIRTFLGFDLSLPKDIYIHDKMANGMIEAPRAPIVHGIAGINTTAGTTIINNGTTEVNFSRGSDTGSNKLNDSTVNSPLRTPTNRRVSAIPQSPSSSTTNYRYNVKIASSGTLAPTNYTRPATRQKLDLKQMDGTIYSDENSVDSRTNLEQLDGSFHGQHHNSKKRNDSNDSNDLNTRMYPNLSLIDEGDERDLSRMAPSILDEDLLRIGMKKEKKKEKCCTIS